ncbi:hypothetical protein FGO68_gene1443 [Halteria grandinella]|uniref:Uncharacterized protein n=1 Tax=Halteria grandinella TaxID=5974 RepID=A0A8J8NGQ2_HALGN|nr:hypothetical protein FGO68_gene1443 [Halteria grandinella]
MIPSETTQPTIPSHSDSNNSQKSKQLNSYKQSPGQYIPSTKLIFLALLLFIQCTHQACTIQAPFPKIVGGSFADTEFQQLDYYAATQYLIAVGYTKDSNVAPGDGYGNMERPFIIGYKEGDYLWGKVFSNISPPDRFVQVKIN